MSNSSGASLPLKVTINKQKNKVLFAEANSDFMNVLLSFLALPLAKVEKNNIALGSINSLYRGLIDMDESYFCSRGAKQMLLNPRSLLGAECRKLAVDITDIPHNQYYVCPDLKCPKFSPYNVSIYSDVATCQCGKSLNREIRVAEYLNGEAFITSWSASSFIVTDDLRVMLVQRTPYQTLSDLGITDTQGAEMKCLSFGIDEIRDLLKFSLTSATPLTDMIITKTRKSSSTAVKVEPGITLHHIPKEISHSRKMVLKVCLEKTTSKFLYAQATDEFVEFLFSLLTVPLGGVEFLLGGKTGLKSIDNLYRSVSNGIEARYFRNPDTKNKLINPKLPYSYKSNKQFLPLISEEKPPELYYKAEWDGSEYGKISFHEKDGTLVSFLKSSKELYLKKQTMCFVKDDLTVCPGLATNISILNSLRVPLSDVKEIELQIGLEEALNILKASLTSKTALTDGLIKPVLNKLAKLDRQPKQDC